MFSVNTNLGAMAALQSLTQTAAAMQNTQAQISTGQKVSSSADNPAVYSIAQTMNAQIAGLTAVQDGLSFSSQVVGTASNSVASISSTLATLKQTLTSGQTKGMDTNAINSSITAALQQINSYANGATMNGVNLIAGSTGDGVTNTQIKVLSDTQGTTFAVGGSGTQALNATAAGLGIDGLSVSSTDTQVALGADSTTANAGVKLVADGSVLAGAAGAAATSTSLSVQTANYATGGTAQNVAQKTYVVLNDGSTNGTNDILNQINAAVAAATGGTATGAATYQTAPTTATSTSLGAGTLNTTPGTNTFTVAAGGAGPTSNGSAVAVSTDPNKVGQYTAYSFTSASFSSVANKDGSTTYTLTGGTATAENYLDTNNSVTQNPINSANGESITLATGATAPTAGGTLSLASATNPGDTTLYTFKAGLTTADYNSTDNRDGTTTYTFNAALDFTKQDFKPAAAATAGSDFALNTDGSIGLAAGGKNGSITDLGNGSTQYSFVTARDANGNATSQVNVISANAKGLSSLSSGAGGTLATALNGLSGSNSAANMATRQAALGTMVSALNGAGFNASIDASNNLAIAGNNLDTTGVANNANNDATTSLSGYTGAKGTNIGGVTTTGSTTTTNQGVLAFGADSSTNAGGIKLVATGNTLDAADQTGGTAITPTATLSTNIKLTNGSGTATDPTQTTVVMLSDGSGFGSALSGTASNSLNDVLNQLNKLSSGIASSWDTDAGHSGAAAGAVDGSAFKVVGGQIVAQQYGGGSITTLSDGSKQYSYVTAADSSGQATSKVNLIVANVGQYSATALDGSTAANSTAGVAARAASLTTMVGAMNAGGFTASLDANNNLSVSNSTLATETLAHFAKAGGGAPAAVVVAPFNLTTTTTTAAPVYGVQQTGATAAIANVTAAITKLGSISSQLGAASNHITGMQTFTSSLSSALTAGVGALTDADMASESAKLTSLQTKQQLGISALSMANQQPQALLKLFG